MRGKGGDVSVVFLGKCTNIQDFDGVASAVLQHESVSGCPSVAYSHCVAIQTLTSHARIDAPGAN
jgi:hypothetical protein